MTVTADTIKTQLHSKLTAGVVAANNYESAYQALLATGYHTTNSPYFYDLGSNIFEGYIKSLDAELSQRYADGTGATLKLAETRFVSEEKRFPMFEQEYKTRPTEAYADHVCECIDFEAMAKEINQRCANLSNNGRVEIVRKALNFLNIGTYHNHFSIRGRYFTTKGCRLTYCYTSKDELHKQQTLLNDIAETTGFCFGSAIREALPVMEALTFDQAVPARTKFGQGCALEITAFNSGASYRFTMDAIDAIQTYVLLHGTEEQQATMINALNQKAAA